METATDRPASRARPRRRLRLLWVVAAFVLAIGASAWWVFHQRTLQANAHAARRALEAGRVADAQALVNRWLGAQPDSAEAHALAAQVALRVEPMRPDDVAEHLARAKALGCDEERLERLRSLLLVRLGNYAEAEPALVRLFRTARGPDPEVDEALARVFLQTYRLNHAAPVLDRWIRDAPRDPRPYVWYTEIDRRSSVRADVMIGHYRSALERDPSLDSARLGLAEALRTAHRTEESAKAYRAYLARKPDDPVAHLGAGRNALERGDLPDAIAHLDRSLALDPRNVAALKERATVDIRQGRFADALKRLDSALDLDAYDGEVWHARNVVLTRLGRTDEAKAASEKAARLRADEAHLNTVRDKLVRSPNDSQLQYEVARWMFDHGHDEEGLRWAKTILQRNPRHAPTNRLLADHYERSGDAGLANFYRLQAGPGRESQP